MITTIEWHRTSDQLPDDDALVIAADSDGDTFAAFVDGNAWRYADAIPAPTPEFWAHFPAGPAAELVVETCKAGLQAEGAEPVAEPVVWMVFTQDGQSVFVTDNPTDIGDDQRALPLYTAPPTRSPLTDSEADALAHEMVKGGKSVQWLVRAIERKITGGNDE